jgi:hypothetical protein
MKSGGKKGGEKKKATADTIKESNAAEKLKKDHDRDLQKLSNLNTLRLCRMLLAKLLVARSTA